VIAVDVRIFLSQKVAAFAAHASQVIEASNFMGLPPGAFHHLLGVEWFHPVHTVDGRFGRLLRRHRHPGLGRPTEPTIQRRRRLTPLIT
jgi:hypothetical protein